MIAVLDASAAVEVALNRSDAASFRNALLQADLVIAPDTYSSEITNIFWKYGKFSSVPTERCEKGRAYCIDLIDDFIPTIDLCREVLSESLRLGHPVYDIFYLIVARRNDALLLTKDKKMVTLARALKIKVHRL